MIYGKLPISLTCAICHEYGNDRYITKDRRPICTKCADEARVDPSLIGIYTLSFITDNEHPDPSECAYSCSECGKDAGYGPYRTENDMPLCVSCARVAGIIPTKKKTTDPKTKCAACSLSLSASSRSTNDRRIICGRCVKQTGIEPSHIKGYSLPQINGRIMMNSIRRSLISTDRPSTSIISRMRTPVDNAYIQTKEDCYCTSCGDIYPVMDYCITSDKQYVCTKCVDRMNMRYSSVNNLTLSDVISYCKEPMGMSDPTFRYNESTRVLHKLSEKGDEHAQYRLGCKYEIGQDVPLDLKTASKLYARSAEQGNVQALGRLLSLATKDENPDAQCYLGEMYFSGQGVPEDRKEAQRLLETSKRNGNVRAHQFLDSLNETPRKKVEPAYFNMDKPWGDVAW